MFGENSLAIVCSEKLNENDGGRCSTNDGVYNVSKDAEGNSVLTGDGKDQGDNEKKFTIAAIETWQIQY